MLSTTIDIDVHKKYIMVFYEYFYQRFSGVGSRKQNLNYKFKPTPKGKEVIDYFLNTFIDEGKTYGFDFYYKYFVFQWNYWYHSEKIKKLTINIGSILDKNAIKRWNERNIDFDFMITDFAKKINVNKMQLQELFVVDISKVSKGEELNKSVYPNKHPNRLAYCDMTTTLFTPFSKICILCSNKPECKDLLKIQYPNLAKERNI